MYSFRHLYKCSDFFFCEPAPTCNICSTILLLPLISPARASPHILVSRCNCSQVVVRRRPSSGGSTVVSVLELYKFPRKDRSASKLVTTFAECSLQNPLQNINRRFGAKLICLWMHRCFGARTGKLDSWTEAEATGGKHTHTQPNRFLMSWEMERNSPETCFLSCCIVVGKHSKTIMVKSVYLHHLHVYVFNC